MPRHEKRANGMTDLASHEVKFRGERYRIFPGKFRRAYIKCEPAGSYLNDQGA